MNPNADLSAKIALFCLATLALCLGACGTEGGELALDVTVLEQGLGALPRGAPAEPGAAPAGIDAFRLCVQKPGGAAEACRDYADLSAGSYKINGLPIGKNWVITFQGYQAVDRRVIWCGRATGIDIANGKTTPIHLLLTRCGDVTRTVEQPGVTRVFHRADSLGDGRVVISGGYDSHFVSSSCDQPCQSLWATASVSVYDHRAGTFAEAPVSLTNARGFHASRALSDGRVLVAGGCEVASMQSDFDDLDRPGSPLRCLVPGAAASTAEILDPITGQSTVTDIPAAIFSAALPVGADQLLLIGGQDEAGTALSRAVLLSIQGDQVVVQTIEQALAIPRSAPLAVLFSRPGEDPVEALVVGGSEADDWQEPGDFAERLVFQSGSVISQVPRFIEEMAGEGFPIVFGSGARAAPGKVLVSGGLYPARFLSQDIPFLPEPLSAAAVADMRTERISVLEVGGQLLEPRAFHTSTTVDAHGHVLIAGGFTSRQPLKPMRHAASTGLEWWDDEAAFFSLRWVGNAPVEMEQSRAGHTATLLPDGTVLLLNGTDGSQILAHAELFNPAPTELGDEGLPPL